MIGSLDSWNGEERVVGDLSDALRLRQSRLAPDLRRVATIAEALQALRKAPLLGFKRREFEGWCMRDERNRCFAEILNTSLHVAVYAAGEVAGPGAADAPDEGPIPGVKLIHTLVGLDHLRPADADAGVLGRDDAAATGGDNPAAAKGSGATTDEGQDRNAGAAHLNDGVNDLGDRELAGIRLLKADAAGIEQQQHGARAARSGAVARSPQQTDEFCAMHFAERAPEDPPLLSCHEDFLAIEAAAAHHDAIVEGAREVELGEVRAHGALLGPKEFAETVCIEQAGNAVAG